MVFFQRSINSSVKQLDEDHLKVESSFLDLEHSLYLELVVRTSTGLIESAEGIMPKSPFSVCKNCVEGASFLVGLKIERGIMGQINAALGGPRSCVHFVELISEAVRLIAMLRAGDNGEYAYPGDPADPEDVVIRKLKSHLKNTCMVFAEEPAAS